jgi:outer membrane protein
MRSVRLIAIFVTVLGSAAFGQEVQKIGYADWDYIFGAMPEFKTIDTQLKAHGDQLQAQVEIKSKEIEDKLRAYQALPATTDELIRADRQKELQRLDEALQQFNADAQKSYELKRQQLMDPVFARVGKAIEDVAKENHYAFILNPRLMSGGDILLFTDQRFDISDLVLKKMGLTPPAKAPEAKKP